VTRDKLLTKMSNEYQEVKSESGKRCVAANMLQVVLDHIDEVVELTYERQSRESRVIVGLKESFRKAE